jgi:flagellar hook-associated protein 2
MASITSLGIGSGIDLESLVSAYIDAEAIPQEIRLQEKEERLNLELSGVGSFKSSLSTFNDILEKFTSTDAFNKQITESDSEALTVKSNGFASNGVFEIDVNQLAQGTRLNSDTFASSADLVGSGTLNFANGTDSFDIVIDGTDSLSDIRNKVNQSTDNFGVTVNIVTGDSGAFLVIDSQVTGVDNALVVTGSDPSLDKISTNNSTVRSALDANITIDGITNVSSSTNTFQNIITDLTLTATELTTVGSPATISVAQDTEYGNELIDEFINGYNALVSNLTGLSAPKQGRLAFDPNVRQVKQDLANTVIDSVSGLTGGVNSLADIGLELDRDGLMRKSTFSSVNILSGQEKLDNALENNLGELGELFASPNGIATQITDMIDGYIASDGVLTQRETTLNERVNGIVDEYENLEFRLRSYEETLRKQFTFLDSTISQYNATSSYLTSALASLTQNSDD